MATKQATTKVSAVTRVESQGERVEPVGRLTGLPVTAVAPSVSAAADLETALGARGIT